LSEACLKCIQYQLNEILDTMDIPEGRRNDYRWLNRNIGIKNQNHRNYERAMQLLDYIVKNI
jgi:hypothetical protein